MVKPKRKKVIKSVKKTVKKHKPKFENGNQDYPWLTRQDLIDDMYQFVEDGRLKGDFVNHFDREWGDIKSYLKDNKLLNNLKRNQSANRRRVRSTRSTPYTPTVPTATGASVSSYDPLAELVERDLNASYPVPSPELTEQVRQLLENKVEPSPSAQRPEELADLVSGSHIIIGSVSEHREEVIAPYTVNAYNEFTVMPQTRFAPVTVQDKVSASEPEPIEVELPQSVDEPAEDSPRSTPDPAKLRPRNPYKGTKNVFNRAFVFWQKHVPDKLRGVATLGIGIAALVAGGATLYYLVGSSKGASAASLVSSSESTEEETSVPKDSTATGKTLYKSKSSVTTEEKSTKKIKPFIYKGTATMPGSGRSVPFTYMGSTPSYHNKSLMVNLVQFNDLRNPSRMYRLEDVTDKVDAHLATSSKDVGSASIERIISGTIKGGAEAVDRNEYVTPDTRDDTLNEFYRNVLRQVESSIKK